MYRKNHLEKSYLNKKKFVDTNNLKDSVSLISFVLSMMLLFLLGGESINYNKAIYFRKYIIYCAIHDQVAKYIESH